MTNITTPLPLAATVGIIGSAWASGAIAAVSIYAIPPIQQCRAPRDVQLRAWHLAYVKGKAMMPPFAGGVAATFAYVAYACASAGAEWRGFAAGAALTAGIVPFTLAAIMPTIHALEGFMVTNSGAGASDAKLSAAGERVADDQVQALLSRWGSLNFVRSLMPLAGTAFAVWNLFA